MFVHRITLARALALAAMLASGGPSAARAAQAAPAPAYSTGIPTAPASGPVRAASCSPLVMENGSTFEARMRRFDTVYGKSALDWTEADFDGLSRLLDACHGVEFGGSAPDSSNWRNAIDHSHDIVLPVAEVVHQVDEYGRGLGSDGVALPRCLALLDFKADPYTLDDNSKDVFGVRLLAATEDDLNRVVLYANQCLLYLPVVAKGSRNIAEVDTENQLGRVMDKALLILKRRHDWADWRKRDTDVILNVEGVVVPPTMTSNKARELIERYDRAAAPGRKFTPETVSYLVRMADEVVADNVTAYDRMYAEEIQRRVQDQIFNHVEVTPSMPNGG